MKLTQGFWGAWRRRKKTKQLWGKEFEVVKEGLAEEQIVGFVNDLIRRYNALLQEQEKSTSLSKLHEQAMQEFHREATYLKMKAKREAEAEAAELIFEAKQRAQEIVAEAKKKAVAAAQKEAEEILSVANQKAEITETQVKQQAQLFLIKARDEIEDAIKGEIKGAYSQLLSSLEELMAEGQNVEADWRSKTAELWKVKAFELKEGEIAFPRIAESSAQPLGPGQVEIPLGIAVEERVEEIKGLGEVAEVLGREVGVEAQPGIAVEERVEEVPAREFTAFEPAEIAVGESLEQRPSLEGEGKGGGEETRSTLRKQDLEQLYAGEVDLVLAAPVDLAMLSQLHSYLQATPELRVLRTVGSWDRGTTVTVLLEKPIPLLGMLSNVAGAEAKPAPPEKGGLLKGIASAPGALGGETRKRIEITFKTD